ncbi:hypothetical protein HK096_003240 [Nowakowskiella sp. JEL0078]|nr:hypothetical protein HK096_003240 [Nowakowskiella sp. JEL0078]
MDDTFSGDITSDTGFTLPPELLVSPWPSTSVRIDWAQQSVASTETLSTNDSFGVLDSASKNRFLASKAQSERLRKSTDAIKSPVVPEFDISLNPWASNSMTKVDMIESPPDSPTLEHSVLTNSLETLAYAESGEINIPRRSLTANGLPTPPSTSPAARHSLEDIEVMNGYGEDEIVDIVDGFAADNSHFVALDPERETLVSHVMDLQEAVREIIVKIETAMAEHMELEDQNAVLVTYINNLMIMTRTKKASNGK